MPYQTGVIEALKDWGLTVHEVRGCRTRGSSYFYPKGHTLHHDVIRDQPGTNDVVPNIIVAGRSDLAGPLANFWLETDGDVHVVALGRANHAGRGGYRGLHSNFQVWGTEMNNLGTAAYPWPDIQLDAAVRLSAATAEFSGFPASMVHAHHEWAPTRKVDPHSIDMNQFRRLVAGAEKGLSVDAVREIKKYVQQRTDGAGVRKRDRSLARLTGKAVLKLSRGERLTKAEEQALERLSKSK